jgi:hypothetical protein
MLEFRDVVVTPYAGRPPYRRGGPHWPDWSQQTDARFNVRGAPHDWEPAPAEPEAVLAGPLAWAGGITWHFGHQISNFSTRLMQSLNELPDVRFAFAAHANRQITSIDDAPEFFPELLDWFGISSDRVEVIAEPTMVQHVVVAPQAEQVPRPGPEPWYLDLMDAHALSRLGEVERAGSLYVSRAGQWGRFAGEAVLERFMEESGFRVLRPETIPLAEQLRAYAGAESLVFAEGSAMHGAQLMGRGLGDVTILTRRHGVKLAQAALKPRARSVQYVDAVRSLVQGRDLDGHLLPARGLSILDPERLCEALPLGGAWDAEEFDAAVEADVRGWLEIEQALPRWRVAGTAEFVTAALRAAGLSHLCA